MYILIIMNSNVCKKIAHLNFASEKSFVKFHRTFITHGSFKGWYLENILKIFRLRIKETMEVVLKYQSRIMQNLGSWNSFSTKSISWLILLCFNHCFLMSLNNLSNAHQTYTRLIFSTLSVRKPFHSDYEKKICTRLHQFKKFWL